MSVTADFTWAQTANPLEVQFTDASTFASPATGLATFRDWWFTGQPPANSESSDVNPLFTFPAAGTYTVTMGVWDDTINWYDEVSYQVTVTGPGGCTGAVADFTMTPESGPAPLDVLFADASVACSYPIDSWYWRFRHPSTNPSHVSYAQSPGPHTYGGPGLYTVVLVVTAGPETAEAVGYVLVLDGGDGPPEAAVFLVAGGHEPADAGATLFVDGADPQGVQRTMPLYASGFPGQTALLTLATAGRDVGQGGVELAVFGGLAAAGGVGLHAHGFARAPAILEGVGLSVTGSAIPAGEGTVSFALHATTGPGWVGGVDLVLPGAAGEADAGVNLVAAAEASDDLSGTLNLTAFGEYPSTASAVPLVLEAGAAACPATWESWTTAWEEAHGVWGCDPWSDRDGGVTLFLAGSPVGLDESGMNLFIDRPEAAMVPFVTCGPAYEMDAGATLCVLGAGLSEDGVDLSLPEVIGGETAGQRLFVRGW